MSTFAGPLNPDQFQDFGAGYVALIIFGLAVVTATIVTLITLVLRVIHEQDQSRRRHLH